MTPTQIATVAPTTVKSMRSCCSYLWELLAAAGPPPMSHPPVLQGTNHFGPIADNAVATHVIQAIIRQLTMLRHEVSKGTNKADDVMQRAYQTGTGQMTSH